MRKLIMIRCQHVISFIYCFTLLIRKYNKILEIGKNYCDQKFNLIYKSRIIQFCASENISSFYISSCFYFLCRKVVYDYPIKI